MHQLMLLVLGFGVTIVCADYSEFLRKQVEHYLQNEDDFGNPAENDAIHEIVTAWDLSGRCTSADFILIGK